MKEHCKIAIIGGDRRNAGLYNLLTEEGNNVGVYGIDQLYKENETLMSLLRSSDVIVGPVPLTTDGTMINTPFSKQEISINDLLFGMKTLSDEPSKIFISGNISDAVRNVAKACNIKVFDLLKREEMAVLNSIPTAEGAIQIAMEEMPITLHGCNALVLGYGRIGKVLSCMLAGIGANVHVTARKAHDFSWINVMHYHGLPLSEVENIASEIDVVFNTIPTRIVNEKLLGAFKTDCLLIDLASKPGGIDFDKAKELGMKSIWALSLPGKVAPFSAARYMKETIFNILEELDDYDETEYVQ